MIQVQGLSKQYGHVRAVDDLSFTVQSGIVTGFLGPNGAGKSTTMRMILGLDTPTSGTALIDGVHYTSIKKPTKWGPCWMRKPSTPTVAPSTTSPGSPNLMAYANLGSWKSSTWWDLPGSLRKRPVGSPSAWDNASA